MPEILYGKDRSAKTRKIYEMLASDASAGKRCMLIVPEQNVLESETALADLGVFSLRLEVFSFRRLANAIFRKYGGLSYNYISDGGKAVIVWKVLRELSASLKRFAFPDGGDMSLVSLLLSAINELQLSAISPEMLSKAVETMNDEPEIAESFGEIAVIYALYSSQLHEKYDDRTDDLTLAEKMLVENDFFAGCNVYIDSFSGFTVQELNIIYHIMKQSDRCLISLGCDKNEDAEAFTRLKNTANSLYRTAERAGKPVKDVRFAAEDYNRERAFMLENLFRPNIRNEEKLTAGGFVKIVKCTDRFSEAETAALDIRGKLLAGARYRDFTITARDIKSYAGVIRSVFEKYDIPVFISDRTEIRSMPLSRLLYSVFYMVIRAFRCDDVVTYIKTGFCGVDDEQCDMLVRYASMWNINGKKWFDENMWRMNPKGFGETYDSETDELLEEINRIRKTVMDPLDKFREAFGSNSTILDISRALYVLIKDLGIKDKLESEVERLGGEGKRAEADETAQLWNAVIDILDTLVDIAGNETVSASEYLKLLEIMFSSANIGKIPPQIDTVSCEPADLYRDNTAGYVYILGVNEGVFPARVSEVSLISDKGREKLREAGIELAGENENDKYADEYLYFYNCASSALKGLTVTYNSESRASVAVDTVKELYEELGESDYRALNDDEKAASAKTALEYALLHRNERAGAAILDHLADADEKYSEIIRHAGNPLTEKDCSVSGEIIGRIAGAEMRFSQSKAEAYVDCPFKFFCGYVFNISRDATGDVESNDIGNYVHKVLEMFFSEVSGRDFRTITEDEINEIADRIIDDYRSSIIRDEIDSKTEYLFRRLSRLSKLMIMNIIGEFSESDFRPVLFEYPIGMGEGIESLPVKVDDETSLRIVGAVDRIDSYVKDGKVYVRVIDYKTGKKKFALSDIEHGINMQMLIYLFSICSSDSRELRVKLGGTPDAEIMPAGVLYMLAGAPDTDTLSAEPTADEAYRNIMESIVRSGLLIKDDDILRAMENGLQGRYIPVKSKKDGTPTYKYTADVKDFDKLKDKITDRLTGIGRDIKSGRADVSPLKYGTDHDPCKYCDMKTICRRREEDNDERD